MRTTAFALVFALAGPLAAAAQTLPVPAQPPGSAPSAAVAQPAPQAQPPAVVAPAPPAPAPKTELLEQILVKVNGEIITKTGLETRQVAAIRQRTQQLGDDELKKAIAEVTPDLLMDYVDELLLLQRGKELGYKVTDEQFKRVLENIRKENKLENDEQFASALKQEGITLDTLRKNLEKQMIINQVKQAEVVGKLGITEAEARTYYEAHKTEFTTQASITLRELLVASAADPKGVNAAADEAARAKIDGALKRAKAGESFAKLVAEISDAPSKANGGLVGPLSFEELDPGIRKLVQPLKPGGVTDVFRTGGGYALLEVEAATTPTVKSFEAARDNIGDKVFGDKSLAEFDKYVRKLRAQAIIEWKNDEMRKLYEMRVAEPAPKAPGR